MKVLPRCLIALLAAVGLALAAPAISGASTSPTGPVAKAAQGDCGCRAWAHRFSVYAPARRRFDTVARRKGVSATKRRQVKERVYDWAREGDFKQSFCTRHSKVCKAAAACLIAAAGAYTTAKAQGEGDKKATVAGAGACATAAASVLVLGR